jgi:membrane protein insertase Oxa1/YidC/SpoIIIJ
MNGQILVAIVIAIPVIIFPAALLWYMNPGGIFSIFKNKNTMHEKERKTT